MFLLLKVLQSTQYQTFRFETSDRSLSQMARLMGPGVSVLSLSVFQCH